jgi:hypothetical protein
MRLSANPAVAAAASVAAAVVLAAVTVVHLFWAFGGTWALTAASGGMVEAASGGAHVFFAVIAVLALVAAVVLLALGGVLPARLRVPRLRRTVWVLAAVLGLGGVVRVGEAPLLGVTVLVLAVLFALVAAAAERPRGGAPLGRRGTPRAEGA